MAEVTTYTFDLKDVAEALVKQQGLHEGKWVLGIEFGLGAGVFGSSPDESRPTAMIQVLKLQLTRHQEGAADLPFVVDAAAVSARE